MLTKEGQLVLMHLQMERRAANGENGLDLLL